MEPEPVPVAARDLIWHLPELLEGTDPVLARPQVREYLKTDPAAGASIEAVALLAQAMSRGAQRVRSLPRATLRPLTRPVEKARRFFKKELVDLLFDAGLAEFDEATKATGLAFDSHLASRSPRCAEGLSRPIDDLARSLELDPRSFLPAEVLAILGSERCSHVGRPSLARAERLMRACDATLPGLDGVRFYLVLVPQLQGTPSDVSVWLDYAASSRTMFTTHAGLAQAAHAAVVAGRPDQAVDLSQRAQRLSPGSILVPYFVALYGALAGQLDALPSRVAEWSSSIGSSRAVVDLAATQVRSDAALWLRVRDLHSDALLRMAARLPAALAMAFDKVMR
ncbi:MAG: hypothetical protein HY812_09690 [Planctomycetes bacterium]|nr:hypothetical protein [Planctomycetota bacterium]